MGPVINLISIQSLFFILFFHSILHILYFTEDEWKIFYLTFFLSSISIIFWFCVCYSYLLQSPTPELQMEIHDLFKDFLFSMNTLGVAFQSFLLHMFLGHLTDNQILIFFVEWCLCSLNTMVFLLIDYFYLFEINTYWVIFCTLNSAYTWITILSWDRILWVRGHIDIDYKREVLSLLGIQFFLIVIYFLFV